MKYRPILRHDLYYWTYTGGACVDSGPVPDRIHKVIYGDELFPPGNPTSCMFVNYTLDGLIPNSGYCWYIYSVGAIARQSPRSDISGPHWLIREVLIDIKPGSYPNAINLSSAGVIPVAILSSETFDAKTVDPGTISLAGAAVKLVGKSANYLSHEEDVNGDGLLDLVCQVNTEQAIIEPGASVAVLEGETYEGAPIRGQDNVYIVPDQ